jgi:uncharacterized membrane protein YjjB (DUF3815 family)
MWANLYISIGIAVLIAAWGRGILARWLGRWPRVATLVAEVPGVTLWIGFLASLLILKPFLP